MTIKRIAVVGSTTVDKIVGQNLRFFKIGGVTTYSGITYARHGIETLAVSNISKKDPQINDRLKKENIVVLNGRTETTTYFVNHINSEGRRQRLPCTAKPISRTQLANVLKQVSVIHLGPLHPSDIDMDAIELLNNSDPYVILDVQGYVRSVRNQIVYPIVSENLSRALMKADIVKANELEYEAILDFYKIDLSDLVKRFNIEEFIVTRREKGGFVQMRTGETIAYAADRVTSLQDPTGAGDVFLAAYMAARFLQQKNIANACAYAARIVARQVAGDYIIKNTLLLAPKENSP